MVTTTVRAAWVAVVCIAFPGPPATATAGAPAPPPASGAPARGAQADPVLTIVEPDGQAQLAGVVRLRADVEPAEGVEAVEFFVDGSRVCVVPAPPFECTWDAGPRVESHVVRVAARLAGGRRVVRSVLTRAATAAFFSARTSAVLVPVAVRDRRGRAVEGLVRDDFALFEDGVRQELSFFEPADMGLDLVLAVDFSASMSTSMRSLRAAARRFVGALPEAARLSLLAFNERIFVVARHEQDRDALLAAVDALPRPYGGTSLLDAIVHALELHDDAVAHKAVVLFSDGEERNSFANFHTAEQRIRASRATLYAVTLGRGRGIERVRAQMEGLTQISGGRSFPIDRIDDLDEVLTRIGEDVGSRYLLGYQPSNPGLDGGWRRIEVRTGNRRHVVQAREGYLAEPSY